MSLIQAFQNDLQIEKASAVWRIIALCFLSVCFVVVVAIWLWSFPYESEFTDTVYLLHGNHTQVAAILDGEVLVGSEQFLRVAEGNQTFVSLGEKTVSYMTKVAGVSYRYNQDAPPPHGYSVSSQRISDQVVIRDIERDTSNMIIENIILPLALTAVVVLLIMRIQVKRVSGYGSNAVYAHVFWKF